MMRRVRTWLRVAGAPVRLAELTVIHVYRRTLSGLLGSRCRFYPSCSEYAEQAVRELGAFRGSLFAAWRILRCSPLSAGGVDRPPAKAAVYDGAIQEGVERSRRVTSAVGSRP